MVNTAGLAGAPGPPAPADSGGGGGSSDAAAPASEACVRDAWARPGSVASNDNSSDRPAYTPPSSGSTSRSTTSEPNRAPTYPATETSPSRWVGGRSGSRLARASPSAESSWVRPSSPVSAGTPMNCRAGSRCITPRLQIRAAVVPGEHQLVPQPGRPDQARALGPAGQQRLGSHVHGVPRDFGHGQFAA